MDRRPLELALFMAVAIGVVPLCVFVGRASRHASTLSLAAACGCALLLGALLVRGGPRLVRVLSLFAVALALAPLADGKAAAPIHLLMFIIVSCGAAILFEVPTRTLLEGTGMLLPQIVASTQDVERLTRLLDTLPDTQRLAAYGLEAELARAELRAPTKIPDDVVTMNSRVVYEDMDRGVANEAVLVYPHEADATSGRVSVLAPIGTALLGLRPGQVIEWPMPTGRRKRIRVLSVPYQPEAAGDYHL